MPAEGLALVLIAGLIHASWNIAAKKAGGDVRFAAFTGAVMMVFWAPLGIWLGLDEIPRWGQTEWLLLAASALLRTLYYVTLLRGYRKADLTVVYPLARGSGPLLSSLMAITLLGEQLTRLGGLGIAGVIVGIISPVSYVLVLYAVKVAPLSHVAPAREVSMLFAALLGGQLLGEGDRVARVLGALLIAAGVIALALGQMA